MAEVLRRRWSTLLLPFLAVAALAAALAPGVASAANTGGITGTVSDSSGPVDGASVVAYLASNVEGGEASAVFATADDGTYTITGLATGSYVVEAEPPSGSNDVDTYTGNVGDPYSATSVAVTNGATTSGTNITLSPGGTVSGTITSPSGGPVAGVDVLVEDAGGHDVGNGSGSRVTVANGSYSISGVAPGTYYVYVDVESSDAANSTNYTSEWYGAPNPGSESALDEANASAITVSSNATTTVNQTLGNGGQITGTITDANGGGDLASDVEAYDGDGDPVAGADSSASNGTYTIYGLPVGSYALDFGPFTNASGSQVDVNDAYYGGTSAAESFETATQVPVSAGGTATANFAAPTGGSITGKVTANGQPVGDVPVELYDSAGNRIDDDAGATSADGAYGLTGLVPGTYKVEFGPTNLDEASNGANLGFQFYNDATSLAAATTVTVTNGQTTSAINGALTTGGQINGLVVGAANAPLANVAVNLEDASGNVLQTVYTAGDGTYTMGGVPAGAYFVEFVPPDGLGAVYQVQYYGGKQVLSGSTPVSVAAGQPTDNIDAVLTGATTAAALTPVAVPYSPTLTTNVPEITGTVKVGDKLAAKTGTTWTKGTAFSYQWYAGGKAIKGATASTLTLVGADEKKTITVDVTGKLSGYLFATVPSAKTKAVAEGTLKTVVPKITGTAKVGDKLTAKPGPWTTGTKFTYQWYASKKAIKGATKSAFTLANGETAKTVTVKVTGKLTGYKSVAKTSPATKKVAA